METVASGTRNAQAQATEESMSLPEALYLAMAISAALLFMATLATVSTIESRRRKAGGRRR